MNKAEAIQKTNALVVNHLQFEQLEFSNRVTDGTTWQGYTEFTASTDLNNDETLSIYVYVPTSEVESVEQLDEIDWMQHISEAEFKVY